MPDKYIDYREVSEYGRFLAQGLGNLKPVAGPLLDLDMLEQMVMDAVRAVEIGLGSSTTSGSQLRGNRKDVGAYTGEARQASRRFFRYLQSLPAHVLFDLEAFYPRRVLGAISRLKPADVLAHCDQVMRGFDAPRNQSLPGKLSWRADIAGACDALESALHDKGLSRNQTRTAYRALDQARKEFLHVYNRVAKPMVKGLLDHLRRGHEYRNYFLDLQLDESARGARASQDGEAAAPSAPAAPADL